MVPPEAIQLADGMVNLSDNSRPFVKADALTISHREVDMVHVVMLSGMAPP